MLLLAASVDWGRRLVGLQDFHLLCSIDDTAALKRWCLELLVSELKTWPDFFIAALVMGVVLKRYHLLDD